MKITAQDSAGVLSDIVLGDDSGGAASAITMYQPGQRRGGIQSQNAFRAGFTKRFNRGNLETNTRTWTVHYTLATYALARTFAETHPALVPALCNLIIQEAGASYQIANFAIESVQFSPVTQGSVAADCTYSGSGGAITTYTP